MKQKKYPFKQASAVDLKVSILIPSGGNPEQGFAVSLQRLVTKTRQFSVPGVKSITLRTHYVSGSMLAYNREKLLEEAQVSGADYCLWLDTDMLFPADTLAHLLRWKRPFVGAQGVTKKIPAEPTAVGLDGNRVYTHPDMRGLVEVEHVGLAVVLIQTKYTLGMTKPRFDMPYSEEVNAHMGEDVYFCRKWKEETGQKIYIDAGLSHQIGHIGRYTYGMKDVDVENTELPVTYVQETERVA